ncbi:MAG: oxidative damage protection protein [Gemmatimonadetes bacterium]|uniref:Oxidative damage protection protein n=1 Tax=Candidatus Kutchimonas denitrificans TaxID=3056748 RepID=A0AAE4Z9C5_9BACT|nr:oxidative damage protection protein [Gemmatimonadota bacterium]NIR74887.1 oxidative damage protection protein [Candidatus Kutchimonas denitrificans]NIR99998.1 oxidative damage protection protein [Gemmatimonadota bacterium]NIT65582.1 oxidative damage protection protein [Gemmatimonadota bacterium]NIU52552.1 oxidative damage protection protein [Gemmatimonadota bacterium]
MTETSNNIECSRCGQNRAQLDGPPFRDELGERVHENICQVCWDEWLQRQMQLINHYALDVRTPEAREFLRRNVQAFLFGEGPGDEIDTSMEGKL